MSCTTSAVQKRGRGFAALTMNCGWNELNLNLLAAVRLDRSVVPAMIQAGWRRDYISSIQRRLPA